MIQKRFKPDLLQQRAHLQFCHVSKDPIGPALKRELQRVGRVVADLRAWRNMSQDDLWQRANISYSQVKRMERGLSDPAISFYMRIAAALNVPLFWLFTEDWPRFAAEAEAAEHPTGDPGE